MRISSLLSLSIAAVLMAACSQAPQAAPDTAASIVSAGNHEAPLKSAATKTSPDLKTQILASGLKAPWNVTFLPNGEKLVTEKLGGIVRIGGDGAVTPLSGVPAAYTGGQGGLFDILLSPNFEQNQIVFLSYAAQEGDVRATRITKARLEGNALIDAKDIFTASPMESIRNHFGGRMAFLPDGTLILTTGDGFSYREKSQDRTSHFGKILRLTQNGKAAGGNPFAGEPEAAKEVYSYGHRNLQGLAYDADTGALWAHEHGPKGGDELNLIKAGDNYGWPIATFGIDYNGAQISPFETYEGMTDSVYYWKPSIAPSGMTVYRGDLFGDMNGDIFIGGLASRDLRHLHMENGRVIREDIWLDDLGERIRDVQTGPDGALYVLTDSKIDGKLIRITPS